jgi:single-strand DNA-binding protein
MADLNKVFLLGNLTRDPETRYVPSGTAVCDLRLAVNRRFRGSDGQDRDETCFVNITAWGRQAETCGQYLRKGSQVLVEGRLKLDQWEKDGQKQSRLEVVADRVQFMSSPRSAEYSDGAAPAGAPARPAPRQQAPSAEAPPQAAPAAPEPEPAGNEDATDEDNLPF